MEEFEAKACLSDYLCRLVLLESLVSEQRVDVMTFQKFLDDVEVLPVLEDVKHLHDVWVVCSHHNIEIVHQKIVQGRLAAEQVLLQNLQSVDLLLAA